MQACLRQVLHVGLVVRAIPTGRGAPTQHYGKNDTSCDLSAQLDGMVY